MALIQCKECGREISASAESCPHCGFKTKQGEVESKSKSLRLKQWIHTILFLVGLVLFVTNIGTVVDRYEEWEFADGVIRDIWGVTKVTYMEYLDAYDQAGVFWATIIGAILTVCCAVGALKNRGRLKRNVIETANERILYGSDTQGSGQDDVRWTCASCGQVNLRRVAYCQSCGVSQSWSDSKLGVVASEHEPVTCPGCGAAAKPGHAFCVHCGAKIDR